MSFLRFFLMSWLASKAMENLEQKVAQTLHEKQKEATESRSKGDADSSRSASSQKSENNSSAFQGKSGKGELQEFQPVEIGMVFAMSQELVGILDQMKSTKITKGNDFKYYSGIWKGRRVVLVESGVGQKRSAAATKALLQIFRPQRLISAGFAGSLVPSLKRFQIIIPHFLVRESDGETLNLWGRLLEAPQRGDSENKADSSLFDDSFEAISGEGIDADKSSKSVFTKPEEKRNPQAKSLNSYFLSGTLLTTDRVVASKLEKESLAQKYGASVVDMETWAVAHVCQSSGVPFLPVRVVLDPYDQELPKEIQNITDSTQNKARLMGALFGAVFKRPSSLIDMVQLKQNALTAADTMALAVEKIVSLNENS